MSFVADASRLRWFISGDDVRGTKAIPSANLKDDVANLAGEKASTESIDQHANRIRSAEFV